MNTNDIANAQHTIDEALADMDLADYSASVKWNEQSEIVSIVVAAPSTIEIEDADDEPIDFHVPCPCCDTLIRFTAFRSGACDNDSCQNEVVASLALV